jgi:hypothetical protein
VCNDDIKKIVIEFYLNMQDKFLDYSLNRDLIAYEFDQWFENYIMEKKEEI